MEESTRRLKRQFCFLSPLQEHHRILQELHNAVIFSTPTNQPPLAPISLAHALSDRYGGPTTQWRLSPVPAGLLLRTPLLGLGGEILFDAQFWEEQYGVWVNPWQCHEEVHQVPTITRVLIEIRDFPIDFWHPKYFLQASSGMGTLLAISPQNSTGENQTSVQPRVRLHVWKLLNNALPLSKIISSRIGRGGSECASCGEEGEDVHHLVFSCPFARACWLVGPLGMRSGEIPNLKEAVANLMDHFTEENWGDFMNTTWALWRCRNDKAYSGEEPTIQKFQKYFQSITDEARVALACNKSKAITGSSQNTLEEVQGSRHTVFVDGSWLSHWVGGIGYVITDNEELVAYHSAPVRACSAIHAEAQALLQAIRHVMTLGVHSCILYSDSQLLVKWCMDIGPPIEADWTAARECYELWRILKVNRDMICVHVPRCQNDLANNLARLGSKKGLEYTGHTFPMFHNSTIF